jgi:hypothetical protein
MCVGVVCSSTSFQSAQSFQGAQGEPVSHGSHLSPFKSILAFTKDTVLESSKVNFILFQSQSAQTILAQVSPFMAERGVSTVRAISCDSFHSILLESTLSSTSSQSLPFKSLAPSISVAVLESSKEKTISSPEIVALVIFAPVSHLN